MPDRYSTTLDPEALAEQRAHNATRTARRHSQQPYYTQPQFKSEPRPDEHWIALGYVKVATVGGYEWHRPFLTPRQRRLRQEALESEAGPAVRCPYCRAPDGQCSH